MCEASTVALAGASLLGGTIKSMAAGNAGHANAQIDLRNAVIAESAAGDARARGSVAAGKSKLQYGAEAGRQETAYASANVDVHSGSPLEVLSDTSMMSELDAKTIQTNALREALGYQAQAGQFRRRAQLDEQMAQAGEFGGMLEGVTGAATIWQRGLRVS